MSQPYRRPDPYPEEYPIIAMFYILKFWIQATKNKNICIYFYHTITLLNIKIKLLNPLFF